MATILSAWPRIVWLQAQTACFKHLLAREKRKEARLLQEVDNNFVTVLGYCTINWARLELAMDLTNFHALHAPGGGALGRELPRSLEPKLAFYKKAHRQIAALSVVSQAGVDIGLRIGQLRQRRHDLIHGLTAERLKDGTRIINRLLMSGAFFDEQRTSYSVNDITDLMTAISRLADDAMQHLERVRCALGLPDDADDFGS